MSIQKPERRTKVGLFSVRNQLMFAIAAVVIVLSATALIVSLSLEQNRIEKDLASRLSTLSQAEADSVQTILSAQLSLLSNLGDAATTGDAAIASAASLPDNPEELQQILQTRDAEWQAADDTATLIRSILNNRGSRELGDFVENVPGHTEVMVTDVHGALASASTRTSDYFQADEAWWQSAWNNGAGAVYIADQFSFDESIGAEVLIIALPLERNGEVVGVLRSNFRADAIQAILSSAFRAGETGRQMIVNRDGLVIASSDNTLTNQTIPSFATLFTIELAQTNQLAEINTMSSANLIGSAHQLSTNGQTPAIDNLNWYLLLALDQSEAYAPIQQTLISTGLISIAVLIASLVLAYYLSRALTRPLEVLTAATQDIAINRNWRARVEVPGNNEFGLLGRTFNAMAAQIQETLTTLEDRVSARTRDMVIAAEVAQKISSTLDMNELLQSVSDLTKERF
ncbi:MAG: HAMP domain-containing protein, partial [Chitinophagaceae bacterium]|nr:HAMP domain-containing protein [Anaerolineae bacterium]